jgi:hypothetical protein
MAHIVGNMAVRKKTDRLLGSIGGGWYDIVISIVETDSTGRDG